MVGGKQVHDAVIIGAGPAGVSCAVWLARLGFAPVLLEAGEQVGGLSTGHPFADGWNATLPVATGPEVGANLAESLRLAQVEPCLATRAVAIHAVQTASDAPACWQIDTDGMASLLTHHVVLATGVRPRGLSCWPHEQALPPGVFIGPGRAVASYDFAGRRIAVLGGGDNAFENALYALDHGAADVRIFARSVRAQHQFVRQFPHADVIMGECRVDPVARTVNGEPWDAIMVFYGWEPCLPDFPDGMPHRTDRGFVRTDWATAATSLAGVYAIGELALRMHPCVVTALADGVVAAKAIQASLEDGRLPQCPGGSLELRPGVSA